MYADGTRDSGSAGVETLAAALLAEADALALVTEGVGVSELLFEHATTTNGADAIRPATVRMGIIRCVCARSISSSTAEVAGKQARTATAVLIGMGHFDCSSSEALVY